MVVTIFTILALVGGMIQFAVPVNYSMSDYLPESAPSTEAIKVMEEEFDDDVANLRVMVKEVTIQEALAYKEELEAVDGVSNVMWLDDVLDIQIPLEFADNDTVESYYVDEKALFTISVDEGKEVAATKAIYEIIGEENAMSGEALDTAISQEMTGQETLNATFLLIPIIIFILLISTRTWIEPALLLTAIGVSILINLGTNIFIGEISFLSQSVAPILQLAVSLDYAIFLLHSFDDFRKKYEPVEAMKQAMKRSFPAISTSALTTFFGFLALTFMEFGIGADLGLTLVKGILLSFLSVMIFLPALTLIVYPWLEKTEHRQFIPNKYRIGNKVLKTRIPVILIAFLIIYPAFLAQSETDFLYGMGEYPEHTREAQDAVEIEASFGKFMPMVLLVEQGDLAREEALVKELDELEPIKSIVSYTNVVGSAIPPEFLDDEVKEQFFSENYSRIILNTTTEAEGDEAFAFVKDVRETAAKYYGEDYFTTGESASLYDMRDVIQKDNLRVNLLTIITIAIVMFLAFRSVSLPIVILFTIQTSVWVNLAIPYFMNDSLVYIGYLIVSIVQLAATLDYGILFTEYFIHNRKQMGAFAAIKKTIDEKIFSITVPAAILSSVGFILAATSSDEIISSIGTLLGRGTLLAYILVVFLLPALLLVFDRVLEKTTLNAKFYKGES